MMRFLLAAAALTLAAAPVAAQENLSPEHAEQRLRGCLQAGSSGAPSTGLREAVLAVRAFCTPQIKRVQRHRVAAARAGLSGDAAVRAERRAIRALNDEIALAISNFTGLTL